VARVVEVAPERLELWLEGFARRDDGAARFDIVVQEDFPHDPLGLVLVRRGGYAVGLARAGRLAAHKTGTRYVQSRTAAGGSSQQRFARRRGNQADELVRAVADLALRTLPPGIPAGLVAGGDRALVREVLADPRLAHLAVLPRRELYDLPDPRLSVLEEALRRGRAVRISLVERPVGS
jgi:hypothetical protein